MTKHAVLLGAVFLAFAAKSPAQTPAGGEFRVSTYTAGDQSLARVAMEPDGDFVVVWRSYAQDGSSSGIFGQRFAASGAPRGNEFRINTYTTGTQTLPSVAVGSAGDFIVVWGSDQDGSVGSIQGQRFDTAGSPLGAEFLVNTFTSGYQYGAHVGRAADGRFVVSWTGPNDGSQFGIAARRFDASGNPVGDEFVVNTFTNGYQAWGDLAVESDGSFVAVWQDSNNNRDGSGSAIFGQRFDAAGNRSGIEFQVNTYTTGNQRLPSVGASPQGDFVVAWSSPGDGDSAGLFARRFDGEGNPVGNDFVVNSYTAGQQYGTFGLVAHDARGNFVITWVGPDGSSYGSFAQRFSASGARRGAEFRVNTQTANAQTGSAAASDRAGNLIVTWSSDGQDGEFGGVYAQRYGSLRPGGLAVDGGSNQVLEPGEFADVPTTSPFYRFVETLVHSGVTSGCSPTQYCPGTATTRDQMAVFVLVAKEGAGYVPPDCTTPMFADVPAGNPFCRWIEELARRGVVGGCGGGNYCPASAVTREQMAVFVLRTLDPALAPPACTTTLYNDVPASSGFCPWIEELTRRAVVSGCGGGSYCPTAAVTREQMGVFMSVTFGLTLYGS